MATIHLPPDFQEFLRLLNAGKVEYLLVGGYAVAYHGYPRATADMDVWVAMSSSNAKKIVGVLKKFGFDNPALSPDLFRTENRIIRMGVPPVEIDITTTLSGVIFTECYEHRVVDTLDGIQVNLIDLEHLKINKQASGSYKDLSDLENLP